MRPLRRSLCLGHTRGTRPREDPRERAPTTSRGPPTPPPYPPLTFRPSQAKVSGNGTRTRCRRWGHSSSHCPQPIWRSWICQTRCARQWWRHRACARTEPARARCSTLASSCGSWTPLCSALCARRSSPDGRSRRVLSRRRRARECRPRRRHRPPPAGPQPASPPARAGCVHGAAVRALPREAMVLPDGLVWIAPWDRGPTLGVAGGHRERAKEA